MNQAQITSYLSDTLHQPVKLTAWTAESRLPLYLREKYDFHLLSLMSIELLLLSLRDETLTPAALEKQLNNLTDFWPGPVCICLKRITPHTRKRLIEKRIQFIVPGTQLYLPCLGLDLREFYAAPPAHQEHFSPSAQALLILILERGLVSVTTKDVTEALRCSLMTATRALGELQAAELCTKTGPRKNAVYCFELSQAWDKALPQLQSPVQRRIWINRLPSGFPVFIAGLEALSEYTEIAADHETVAANSAVAKEILAQPAIEQLPYQEPGAVELEVWRYDPAIAARAALVDPRSLYLCFADSNDERIQMELERMKSLW